MDKSPEQPQFKKFDTNLNDLFDSSNSNEAKNNKNFIVNDTLAVTMTSERNHSLESIDNFLESINTSIGDENLVLDDEKQILSKEKIEVSIQELRVFVLGFDILVRFAIFWVFLIFFNTTF